MAIILQIEMSSQTVFVYFEERPFNGRTTWR